MIIFAPEKLLAKMVHYKRLNLNEIISKEFVMRQDIIEFKAGTVIEVSFARINVGKEGQLFGEYFPKVMPILAELGGQSLGAFAIVASNSELEQPQMCALFQWPSLEAFEVLHRDERFLAIKGIRDEALTYLSNGHFFEVLEDISVTFIEGQAYSLKADNFSDARAEDVLLDLKSVRRAKGYYQLDKISISEWKIYDDSKLTIEEDGGSIFQLKRNFPA